MRPALKHVALRTVARPSYTAARQYTCLSCRLRLQPQPPRSTQRPEHIRVAGGSYSAVRASSSNSRESIAPQNHYEFFPITLGADAIPPAGKFVVDLKALRKEFLQLQGKAHPDAQPASKKRQAEALSARINEAYKTLQNPLLRAQYILSLRGIDVAEDETAKVEDPELLMEVLETRETIEDAQEEKDLDPLKATNDARIRNSEEILEEAFKSDDMDLAKSEAVKLRYWVNIKESIDAWEKGKPVVLIH